MHEYFYGAQAEQFSFYRIPKVFFTDDSYRVLSTESKVLYGILLERMNLSARNGWVDKEGRVFIVFTVDEIMRSLGCADQKATKLMNELERAGLIERKRQGLCRPNLIYVKNFIRGPGGPQESRPLNRENHDSGTVKTTAQEPCKSRCRKKEKNDTELSDTDLISSDAADAAGTDKDRMADRGNIEDYFRWSIELENLISDYPDAKDTVQGLLELLVDVCSTSRTKILVGGEMKPSEAVKARLMKLKGEHIRYVMECLRENHSKVKNIRQYLLSALYNAPVTMGAYYQAKVNHDMYGYEGRG